MPLPPSRFVVGLGVAALALVWGTQYLVIRAGLVDLPPLSSAALRFAIVALLAQVALWLRPAVLVAGRHGARLALGLAHTGTMALLYFAQTRLDSSVVGVLLALSPLIVVIAAARAVPGERLEPKVALGTAVGVVGAALIASAAQGSGEAELVGLVAAVAATLLSAATRVLAKRLVDTTPPHVVLRDLGFIVTLTLAPMALLLEQAPSSAFTPTAIGSVVYLGVVASTMATALSLWLLQRVSLGRMAYLPLASAGIALVAGVVIGGERLDPLEMAGAALILGGLLGLRSRRGSMG